MHDFFSTFAVQELVISNCSPSKIKCSIPYVGFTRWHLHQYLAEHKGSLSSIGKHFGYEHLLTPKDLSKSLKVLKKCTNKFGCLVYEMFFINELRPSLNVQSDSICAKGFEIVPACFIVSNAPF